MSVKILLSRFESKFQCQIIGCIICCQMSVPATGWNCERNLAETRTAGRAQAGAPEGAEHYGTNHTQNGRAYTQKGPPCGRPFLMFEPAGRAASPTPGRITLRSSFWRGQRRGATGAAAPADGLRAYWVQSGGRASTGRRAVLRFPRIPQQGPQGRLRQGRWFL